MASNVSVNSSTPLAEKNVVSYSDVENAKVDHINPVQTNWMFSILKCVGPGLMLGLANSNAGDLLAAAQSGAKYKFLYLPWIVLLAVPLYFGTELVTRVSVVNRKPLLRMIYDSLGFNVMCGCAVVLTISCMGGLVMQICTFVAVGDMWGIPGVPICVCLTTVLVLIAFTDNVQRMERIGITLGLFELAFCISAVLAKPDTHMMISSASAFVDTFQNDHITITGALIGAVLMPWMFFYQSSAVHRNNVIEDELGEARLDIGLGTVASQTTMGSILVTFAIAMQWGEESLDTVPFSEVPFYLAVALPHAKFLFSMGMLGASFVASLAIALTISWAVEEICAVSAMFGVDDEESAQVTAKLAFSVAVMVACMCSLTGVKAIFMIIFCDIVNSLTVLPIILAILYFAHTKLSKGHALTGSTKVVTFAMLLFMGFCGLYSASCYLYTELLADRASEVDVRAFIKAWPVGSLKAMSWRYSSVSMGSGDLNLTEPFIYLVCALVLLKVLFRATQRK